MITESGLLNEVVRKDRLINPVLNLLSERVELIASKWERNFDLEECKEGLKAAQQDFSEIIGSLIEDLEKI